MPSFNIGDVVYLKSGSKPMTVINVPQLGGGKIQMIGLQWDNGGSLTGAELPEASLTSNNPKPVLDKATQAVIDGLKDKAGPKVI